MALQIVKYKSFKNILTFLTAVIIMLTVQMQIFASYSVVNINHTGSYDCDQNSNAFITVSKTEIGVFAYQYDKDCYVRATTNNGAITTNMFTGNFSKGPKCDRTGTMLGTYYFDFVLQDDVRVYSTSWLFGQTIIEITTRESLTHGFAKTYSKPFDRYYA